VTREFIHVQIGLADNKAHDPVRDHLVSHRDDAAFDDDWMLAYDALDLAEFNTISTALHLVIPTTQKAIATISHRFHQVTGPVNEVA
jgi:hypothetical protein